MLESTCHEASWFTTLTYAPEHLPGDGSVVPRHGQLFLKRLRKAAKERIRFFLVGEYGETTFRPHYHAVLFGLHRPELVEKCWQLGQTRTRELNQARCGYIGAYTVKKMTAFGDARLDGRHPEFARMSLNPGLGVGAISQIVRFVNSEVGSKWCVDQGDVPGQVRWDGRKWNIGRYLKQKVIELSGHEGDVAFRSKLAVACEHYLELCLPGGVQRREELKERDRQQADVLQQRILSGVVRRV